MVPGPRSSNSSSELAEWTSYHRSMVLRNTTNPYRLSTNQCSLPQQSTSTNNLLIKQHINSNNIILSSPYKSSQPNHLLNYCRPSITSHRLTKEMRSNSSSPSKLSNRMSKEPALLKSHYISKRHRSVQCNP